MAEGTVPGCIGRRGKGWLRADGVDRGVDDGGPVGLRIVRVTQKIAGPRIPVWEGGLHVALFFPC